MIDEKEKFQAAENILASIVCEVCGIPERPTKYVANPYDEDVNQKVVMQHLCDGCFTACKEDI